MRKGKVLVRWEHEGGSEVLEMSKKDADKAKKLLVEAQLQTGEFPDEVNKILDRATKTAICGSIATYGDGWGWYEGESE
jgi:hypothetical protein